MHWPLPDPDAALGQALEWRSATVAGLRLPGSSAELVVQTERPGPEAAVFSRKRTAKRDMFTAS